MARALIALALAVSVALLATPAAAQSCGVESGNVYRASACAGYTACASSYCGCTGASGTSDLCLAQSTANCSTFIKCSATFVKCLNDLAGVARLNSSDPCNSWAVLLHSQMLNAAIGSFNGSALQSACAARVCELKNRTSLGAQCNAGVNASQICVPGIIVTTAAPSSSKFVVRASIRLSGDWTAILADPAKRKGLEDALRNDIAALLGIDSAFIEILALTSGSLVIDFAVKEGANVSVATLESRINTAAANTNWLSTVKTYAAANGGPTTFTVTSAGVTTTTVAGGPTPSSPSISSASSVSAAVAVAVAALALLF